MASNLRILMKKATSRLLMSAPRPAVIPTQLQHTRPDFLLKPQTRYNPITVFLLTVLDQKIWSLYDPDFDDARKLTGWRRQYVKSFRETNGVYHLGLLTHDLLDDEMSPIYKEAISRLRHDVTAQDVYNAREHRLQIAFQLDTNGFSILPEEEWTKFEDDEPYMTPYIRSVREDMWDDHNWARRCGVTKKKDWGNLTHDVNQQIMRRYGKL